MIKNCSELLNNFEEDIQEIVDVQRNEKREAIFFIYEQGFTEGPFKGTHTSINLSKDEEKMISRKGNIVGSVHTHPTGFDPSTIDIVTGISSGQNTMCVATPIEQENYVLTCLRFEGLNRLKEQQVMQAMRRSSMGITNLGRVLRREFNFKRFDLDQCRVKA